MIKKVVKKRKFSDSAVKEDLEYWLSRPSQERISAVEVLRKQYYGNTSRLQRVASVIQHS